MKTQHTPGPWYIEDDFIEPNQRKISCQGLGLALTFGDTEEEAQANATLVSAAPELLESLERAHSMLMCLNVDYDKLEMRTIRAAIAKAKGDQV